MKMTSSEANKLIKKLKSEQEMLLQIEQQAYTFTAAVEENPDDARPDYSFEETTERLNEIETKIRKIKHALNVFNTTHKAGDYTLDEALVRIPMLSQKAQRLSRMAQQLPKSRIDDRYNSGPHITYRYANYDVAEAKRLYQETIDELNRLQIALDNTNRTEQMDIDI